MCDLIKLICGVSDYNIQRRIDECIELIFVFMETTMVDIQPLYIFSCIFILALLTYYSYIYTYNLEV